MKNKALWAAVFLLLLICIYNALDNFLLRSELSALSDRLDSSLQNLPAVNSGAAQLQAFEAYSAERTVPIVAVSGSGDGVVGNLTVKIIPGNNNVLLSTNPFVETDIQYSANKAVAVAKLRSNYHYNRDYLFDYRAAQAQLIGGESAGAAATVALMAAMQNKSIRKDTAITGTIETDGSIGKIGGVIEKAKAVADAGYKRFLIPKGQGNLTYYEREVTQQPTRRGFIIQSVRYVPRVLDLKATAKDEWGLDIIEVGTIEDAVRNMVQ